jgi:hypothetical protein
MSIIPNNGFYKLKYTEDEIDKMTHTPCCNKEITYSGDMIEQCKHNISCTMCQVMNPSTGFHYGSCIYCWMDGQEDFSEDADSYEDMISRWVNIDLIGALDVLKYGVEYKGYKQMKPKITDKDLLDWLSGMRAQYEMGAKMGHIMKYSHKREDIIKELTNHTQRYIFKS